MCHRHQASFQACTLFVRHALSSTEDICKLSAIAITMGLPMVMAMKKRPPKQPLFKLHNRLCAFDPDHIIFMISRDATVNLLNNKRT